MSGSRSKKIYLLQADPIHTESWIKTVRGEPDLFVCGPDPDFPTAVETIAAELPDLVIMNLAGDVDEEIALIEELRRRCRDLAILVLAMEDEVANVERALRAGALGYLTNEEADEEILPAIRKLLAGDLYLGSRLFSKLLERLLVTRRPSRRGPRGPEEVSRIEGLDEEDDYQVFLQVGLGKKIQQIADELETSRESVEHCIQRLKEALELKDDFELLRCAHYWVRKHHYES